VCLEQEASSLFLNFQPQNIFSQLSWNRRQRLVGINGKSLSSPLLENLPSVNYGAAMWHLICLHGHPD
jgi:hypothetical protein